jgi:Fanconi-associated nuclease 1
MPLHVFTSSQAMLLQDQSPTKHNRMLGQRITHAKSTNFYEPDEEKSPRPVKRLKREVHDDAELPSSPSRRDVPTDEAGEAGDDNHNPAEARKTDLETALPPIATDQGAIDEYEARRAAEEEDSNALGTAEGRLTSTKWVRGKDSIYVDAFNLALDTVLEEETHLFDAAEKKLFQYWKELSYEGQYLYVRLFLRKTSAWHRVNNLGYHSDIGDLDKAIEELQSERELPPSMSQPESYPGELEPPEGTTLEQGFTFADHSRLITSLEEASSLLKLDELKGLAKDARVQGKNKRELLQALCRTSRQQVGLIASLKRADTNSSNYSSGDQTPRSETPFEDDDDVDRNRDVHFTRKIMNETGPCIRLSFAPLKLFERVHLVFYRSTEWTEKSLTAIILAKIARWNFPEYIVSRSASVFGSRGLLLEYEAALRTQFKVDSILEFNGPPVAKDLDWILDTYKGIYPRWRVLLREEQRKEDSVYQSGEGAYLRRLSPAWVYARILHKATDIMGRRKEHENEHRLLSELLEQRLFHHARRGAWYQRKALLEEHYMHAFMPREKRDEEMQKRYLKRVALRTCEDGLQDPLVHLIYHYDLQKRVTKLEKGLKIPKREQHTFSHVRLAAAVEVYIDGTRVELDPNQPIKSRRNSSPNLKPGSRGQKTIWLDPLEDNRECSVEAMCLSHYRSEGWKGYHSEGRLARTLFAYLFYDVLFTYIPNVFQTPFQTCPLDLHTDAFYPSRLSEINHRLLEISNGFAPDLIRRIWEEHSQRMTCVVGLDWTYRLEDLLEIAELFPGEALASVCRVLAQEYGQRGGGMPDLFLWHMETREVKFAEVKSENDRLSDTQRLWIHVLTGAGVKVELANAVAKEVQRI